MSTQVRARSQKRPTARRSRGRAPSGTEQPSFAAVGRILALVGAASLVVLLLAEGTVRLISGHLPPPTSGDTQELVIKKEQMEALAEQGQVEVAFLGNSTMDAGLDATRFGQTSTAFDTAYNAALLGIPLDTQARWFGEVVLPILDPQVVVLGMNPVDVLQSYYTEGELAVVNASFHSRFREIEQGPAAAINRVAYDDSYLIRYRGSLRAPFHVVEAAWNTATFQEPQGIWSRPDGFFDRNVAADGASLLYRGRTFDGEVSDKLVDDLQRTLDSDLREGRIDRLVDQVEEAGHDPVVVIPPVSLSILSQHGIEAARWREVAAQIASEAQRRDVPVVDFSTVDYPDSAFSDPMHLNAAGTERFTDELAAAIDQHCLAGAIAACS